MRPVNQWNNGKQQEFKDRKLFDITKTEPGNYKSHQEINKEQEVYISK
jgi:hypothetical protein